MSNEETYEIYAVHYGHHDRQSTQNYIGGDTHDFLQPLDYYVWAIVGKNGTYVVDTGFDEAMGKKRKRTLVRPIADGLKALGIQPDAIEISSAGHRNGLCDGTLHVPLVSQDAVRGGRRRRHGAQIVRRPRGVS
jgi:hypothetical protein